MTGALFPLFDRALRQQGLGASAQTREDHGDHQIEAGDWLYLAAWRCDLPRAQELIAALVARAQSTGRPVLWRVYAPDGPPGLSAALAQAGFTPQPPDTLLSHDLSALPAPELPCHPLRGPVEGQRFQQICHQCFGSAPELSPPAGAGPYTVDYLAWQGPTAISAGCLDLAPKGPAALLRGGCTDPAWRGQGGFSALVLARLRDAAAAGARRAFVEARPSSAPLLLQLGFAEVSTGTAWVYTPAR